MARYILAIDQGTTSSRAILFNTNREIFAVEQQEFAQHYPGSGWVEHEVEDIWQTVQQTCRGVISSSGIDVSDIAGIGITNQRETTIVWDKQTGEAVHRAIVWQDRRTADYCASLKEQGHEAMVTEKTGLLLDPYFSATKLRWILENVDGARNRAEAGELLFGTVDCYLLWKLTGGKSHKTDATNAARTALFNIHEHKWDEELCALLDIPMGMLPQVEDCAADFGNTETDLLGASIPVLGIAGDQQAALIGQACFQPGMMKSTYGTGCFAILNTGDKPVQSTCRLLTTIGYRLDGETTYALEGSIFIAGAAVQWLRDGINIIDDAAQSGDLALAADEHQDVILVPAFAGLGAPYWEPNVRGAMFGMTRNTSRAEFARATLESVCFQTRDLIEAMQQDYDFNVSQTGLRVDGGMVASDWTMQSLADILGGPVDRPAIFETTALGAAWLAGQRAGIWPNRQEMQSAWQLDRQFTPALDAENREIRYKTWQASVQAAIMQSRGSAE